MEVPTRFHEVPPDKVLSPLRVWEHANGASRIVLAALALCCVVSVALWAWRLARRNARGAEDPIAVFMTSVALAAPPLGLTAAAWAILKVCVGTVNDLPTPGLLDLMPGLAEAAMAVFVGLATSSLMLVLRGHLAVSPRAPPPDAHI